MECYSYSSNTFVLRFSNSFDNIKKSCLFFESYTCQTTHSKDNYMLINKVHLPSTQPSYTEGLGTNLADRTP